MKKWYVYLLQCADRSYYCGITTDVDRRINEHNHGKRGAKYTSARRPVILLNYVGVDSRSDALQLERFIKSCHRAIKPKAIELFKKFIT